MGCDLGEYEITVQMPNTNIALIMVLIALKKNPIFALASMIIAKKV